VVFQPKLLKSLQKILQNVHIKLVLFMAIMMVLAEFEFYFGSNAGIIYNSLLPELEEDCQRTSSTLKLKDTLLILTVEAKDIVSMRAALNGWLRLIRISHEINSITNL
jgi:KEOPS complex subunit Pcc1